MKEKPKQGGMGSLVLPEIADLLASRQNPSEISEAIETFEPADIAEIVPDLPRPDKNFLFSILSPDYAAEVFENLEHREQLSILEGISPGRGGAILDEVEPDDRADFLAPLPPEVVERFLSVMEKDEAEETTELLKYAPSTAGGLMTTRFLKVGREDTVARALEKTRIEGREIEEIYQIFVVDRANRLCGTVSLRELVLANPSKLVSDIMSPDPVSIGVDSDQEEAAREIKKYDLVNLPVTGRNGRLEGVISVDDVIDVITEEQTEDVYRMGAAATVVVRPYSEQGPIAIVRQRLVWLILLVLLGFFSGFIIERYEALMSSFVALAFFIPLLMDTGGNAGTQASTVVIRGLATGEVRLRDLRRVVSKEMAAGVIAGLLLGLLSTLRVFALGQGVSIAIVVSLSMACTITIATTLGAILPLACRKANIDPAVVSSPLITTILDVSALFIYFELARKFLVVF